MPYNKPCPRCGKPAGEATFNLMMVECDECICKPNPEPEKYIDKNGLFIVNPKWEAYNASRASQDKTTKKTEDIYQP
jgi:hypothetical protein